MVIPFPTRATTETDEYRVLVSEWLNFFYWFSFQLLSIGHCHHHGYWDCKLLLTFQKLRLLHQPQSCHLSYPFMLINILFFLSLPSFCLIFFLVLPAFPLSGQALIAAYLSTTYWCWVPMGSQYCYASGSTLELSPPASVGIDFPILIALPSHISACVHYKKVF